MHLFGLTSLVIAAADYYRMFGAAAVATELVLIPLFTMAYFVLVERAATGFRALHPQFCSIYDRYFWWHERFWKLVIPEFDKLLAGTPFKNLLSRLLGVRLGRRVFDDGCFMPERTLVTIGDDCTLNAETVIQCHSQEDGHFKSDRTTIEAACTLGVGAFVHYGVALGKGAVLGPGSFVMKGEEVPPNTYWQGNPAAEIQYTATETGHNMSDAIRGAVVASRQDGSDHLSVYVRLTRQQVVQSIPDATDDVVVDINADGEIVGIEILGAIEVTVGGSDDRAAHRIECKPIA